MKVNFWNKLADPHDICQSQLAFCKSSANRKLLCKSYQHWPVLSPATFLVHRGNGYAQQIRAWVYQLPVVLPPSPSLVYGDTNVWVLCCSHTLMVFTRPIRCTFQPDEGFDSMEHSCSMMVHTLVDKESDGSTFFIDLRIDRRNDLTGIAGLRKGLKRLSF